MLLSYLTESLYGMGFLVGNRISLTKMHRKSKQREVSCSMSVGGCMEELGKDREEFGKYNGYVLYLDCDHVCVCVCVRVYNVKSYQHVPLKDMQFTACQTCLNNVVSNIVRQPFIKIVE